MMHAIVSKTILQRVVTHTGIVTDKLNMTCLDDGWKISITDPAKVAMMNIMVWTNAMDSYEVQVANEDEREIIFDLEKLASALSIFPDGQPVEITFSDGVVRLDCGRMHRAIRNEVRVEGEPRMKIPEVNLRCSIPLDTTEIYKMISKSGGITDHLTISCGPNGLSITLSSEVDNVSYENDDEEVRSPDGETYTSMFPLDYFVRALSGFKGPVILEIDNDYPLKMFSNDPFPSTYLLAPRVERDDIGGA